MGMPSSESRFLDGVTAYAQQCYPDSCSAKNAGGNAIYAFSCVHPFAMLD